MRPVAVVTDQTSYEVGEEVSVTIKNKSASQNIWFVPRCGETVLIALLQKVGLGWKMWDAFPTKDCTASTPIKIEQGKTLSQSVDLRIYERGGDDPFVVQPGTYRFELVYSAVYPRVDKSPDIQYVKVISSEFTMVEITVK